MIWNNVLTQTIPTTGGNYNIAVTDEKSLYVFIGSGILTGNVTIAASGTPYEGLTVEMRMVLNFTLGVNTFTVFGRSLTAVQVTKTIGVTAVYINGSWRVFVEGLFGLSGTVETGDIADDAVTLAKLAAITRGSLIVGGASDAPTEVDFKTAGQIAIGDGTDLKSVPVSGDMTLSGAGVAAIAAGAIVNADINAAAAIALSKLQTSTGGFIIVFNGSGVPVAVAMSGDIAISNAGVTSIASGAIVNADINASAGIALSKLAGAAAGSFIVADGSNVFTAVAMSGDGTITDAGVFTLADGTLTLQKISPASFFTRQYNAGGVATSGTSEETLSTTTYTAGSMSVNGQSMTIEVTGFTAANGNNKRIRVKWQGNTMADTGALAANNATFFIRVVVTRQSASEIYYKYVCNVGGTVVTGRGTISSIDFTASQSVTVTGETPTSAGDATWLETILSYL